MFMRHNGIGVRRASFWISWAAYLEERRRPAPFCSARKFAATAGVRAAWERKVRDELADGSGSTQMGLAPPGKRHDGAAAYDRTQEGIDM